MSLAKCQQFGSSLNVLIFEMPHNLALSHQTEISVSLNSDVQLRHLFIYFLFISFIFIYLFIPIQLECGQDHSLFLTDDGRLLSCGLGADGQTGVGHYRAVERPTLIEGDIKGENITHMSSRGDCVLVCSGRVITCRTYKWLDDNDV